MGDSRVGKTSLMRNLCGKKFLLDIVSTLVLNDIDIFGISPESYSWSTVSKYDLSVQRVKNTIPSIVYFDFDASKNIQSKYKLDFEKELLYRTVQDKDFVEGMKTSAYGFKSIEIYFRVCDFGGQEIFSSVHHIFMNSNSLYFVVFNMTKVSKHDLRRLKFWLESILKNAPEAPTILVGTYLKRYKRKNNNDINLKDINNKISTVFQSLSNRVSLLGNEDSLFFPVENSVETENKEFKELKDKIIDIISGASGLSKIGFLSLEINTASVLFLDNCREQTNIMTLSKFEEKAISCGFDLSEIENMLEIYSRVGLIYYFPDLDLEADENFVFFAPSYLAQALGSFIRDPTFHQLSFRIPSDLFPLYRSYVDSGIISIEIFNVLLKEYTEKEKKYIFELSINYLILVRVENEVDRFILPGLLPPINNKIKPTFTNDIEFSFNSLLRLSVFVKVITFLQKEDNISECIIYKYFSRFIFNNNRIVDIFVESEKSNGFSLVQGGSFDWLKEIVGRISMDLTLLDNSFIFVQMNNV